VGIVRARAAVPARDWFDKALAACAERPLQASMVLGYYSGASRRMGKLALRLAESERSGLERLWPGLPMDHWGLDEAARAALLLAVADSPADEFRVLALQAYELGDSREQESWLRALWLLPRGERFTNEVIDACRTNIKPLFEAIACENPYPSRYFPQLNFNQMVLKTLFMGVELSRIIGFEQRLNRELSEMANDYVSEREAAGRGVPADIWLVIASHAGAEALTRLYRYSHDPDPRHRYHAAVGLGLRGDPAQRPRMEDLLQQERDPKVISALQASLTRLAARARNAG
jgi:hypothetical protein